MFRQLCIDAVNLGNQQSPRRGAESGSRVCTFFAHWSSQILSNFVSLAPICVLLKGQDVVHQAATTMYVPSMVFALDQLHDADDLMMVPRAIRGRGVLNRSV